MQFERGFERRECGGENLPRSRDRNMRAETAQHSTADIPSTTFISLTTDGWAYTSQIQEMDA